MNVVETLLPIILFISLGLFLARIGFLESRAAAEMTRFVFWIALPSLIFESLISVHLPLSQIGGPLAVLVSATLLCIGAGWLIGRLRGSTPGVTASMVQNGFRGNLAFIGLPVVTYSVAGLPDADRTHVMGVALLVIGPMMVVYNLLAILVLLGAQHRIGAKGLRLMMRSIFTNPLILAAGGGIIAASLRWHLPEVLSRVLKPLGQMTVPMALICIGASLASVSLKGRRAALWIGLGLKVAFVPLAVWALADLMGCPVEERRILLLFSACPTAAASYVMAHQMGADAELAASGIALSTMASFIPLSLVLAFA